MGFRETDLGLTHPVTTVPAPSLTIGGGWAKIVEDWAPAQSPEIPKSGPVAQLGARFHGMEEVVGSIPTRSTKFLRVLL